MADFDLLKIKVKFRFFSVIENAPPLTKPRRLRYCASKSVQPLKYKKKRRKKEEKKHKTIYVAYMYLSP